MVECTACRVEVASYDRRCWNCGAGIRRDTDTLFSEAPTDKELHRAQLCHLLALPGMVILVIAYPVTADTLGLWALAPLNLIIPLAYWLLRRKSRFVRSHGAEVVNFQLPWTLAICAAWFWLVDVVIFWVLPIGISIALFLWVIGSALVWIASIDAANAGDGKYPFRIPIFRLAGSRLER